MQATLIRKWKVWLHRRRKRKAVMQLEKRKAVLLTGIPLYVQVIDACPTRVSVDKMQLVRLQLHIRLLNNAYLRTPSYAFIHGNCQHLKGQHLRIRFLPGDLSHVVLLV